MFNRPVAKEVTGANVLVAIFSEQESQAVYLLKSHGVSRIDVVNFISHGISKIEGTSEDSDQAELGEEKRPRVKNAPAHWSPSPPTLMRKPKRAGSIHWWVATRRLSVPCRFCVGVVKTTHCWWVSRALVRPPLPRG